MCGPELYVGPKEKRDFVGAVWKIWIGCVAWMAEMYGSNINFLICLFFLWLYGNVPYGVFHTRSQMVSEKG